MKAIKCVNGAGEFYEKHIHGSLENPEATIKCSSVEAVSGFMEPTVVATVAESCTVQWTGEAGDTHIARHYAGDRIIVAEKFIVELPA